MQSIQLHAASVHDKFQPEKNETMSCASRVDSQPNLDGAIAQVLQTVRNAQTPAAMQALGALLSHMENLEKLLAEKKEAQQGIVLCCPRNLTL